jgi:hypothetical protein
MAAGGRAGIIRLAGRVGRSVVPGGREKGVWWKNRRRVVRNKYLYLYL